MSGSVADRRIRALRGPKPVVDPWKAHGSLVDEERRPSGAIERALTVFLAGAECSFTCSFCDLWRYTIDGPTPSGALPAQIADTLASINGERPERIKLYNASNFFDRRSVPVDDLPRIAELCAGFEAVTVESHASTVGPGAVDFASRLSGSLEVAMGLETIHPVATRHLNKRLDLERFDRASAFLVEHGIDVRVFVLLGAPHVPASESVEWTVRTAQYAEQRGAAVVSIIAVRGGNGEMERLGAIGEFAAPTLRQLETTLDTCVGTTPNWGQTPFRGSSIRTVVTADLWDADRLPGCESCRASRIERLRRLNVRGRAEPPIVCAECDR